MEINIYQAVKDGIFKEAAPTGSKFICNPPVLNTDDDWIVLVDDLVFNDGLMVGWERGGSIWEGSDNYFFSYKKDNINLIITEKPDFYSKVLLATYVAKKLNLLKKEDRITLFQAILYGNKE